MKLKDLSLVVLMASSMLGPGTTAQAMQVLTEHSPPGEYLDENGRVTGATAELVRELLSRVGESTDIKLLPRARAYNIALVGPEVALFETTRTPAREKLFKWVGPIKQITKGFYVRRQSGVDILSLEDARDLDGICAYRGGAAGQSLLALGFTNVNQPSAPAQCLDMLMFGRVDAWVTSDIGHVALFASSGYEAEPVVPALVLESQYLYIAMSKDTPDATVRLWQQTLDEMKQDGSLVRFYRGVYPDDMIDALTQQGHPDLPWLD